VIVLTPIKCDLGADARGTAEPHPAAVAWMGELFRVPSAREKSALQRPLKRARYQSQDAWNAGRGKPDYQMAGPERQSQPRKLSGLRGHLVFMEADGRNRRTGCRVLREKRSMTASAIASRRASRKN
jgi:hypothetical protein